MSKASAHRSLSAKGAFPGSDGELEGKRYLSHAAMDERREEQTGKTRVNYSLGYHLRNGMYGHDGAYDTDLSVHPRTGMVAIFMVQLTSADRWAARDLATMNSIAPNASYRKETSRVQALDLAEPQSTRPQATASAEQIVVTGFFQSVGQDRQQRGGSFPVA
jgi:hypothetical protein